MKKTTKNIVIALAVLLVLGVAAAVLLTLPEPADTAEESGASSTVSGETTELLIDHNITEVEKIVLENNIVGETWELLPTKDDEELEENNTFTFKDWDEVALINSDVANVARSFYTLYQIKEIGEVQDLSEYGLSGSGEVKAVVDYTDGTSETVIVGRTAGETAGRYVLYNDLVYIASVSSLLEQKQTDFVNTSILTIVPENQIAEDGTVVESVSVVQSMHFSGKNYPEEILLQESDDRVWSYELVTPIYTGASVTSMQAIVDQMESGITATGVAVVNATEEDMVEYGLDEPSAVLDFEINDEEHVLRLGNLTNGEYPLMIDDNTTIYLVSEDSVDSWANKSLFDLRDPYVRLVNIKEAETLTVTDKSGTDVYTATRILNEEKSTETQPFYDLTVEKDGQNVDYETAYQPFYSAMLKVCVLNEDVAEPTGEALLTITYDYFESSDKEVVEYYAHPENDRRCVVVVNGETNGVVRASDVEDLMAKKAVVANFEALE